MATNNMYHDCEVIGLFYDKTSNSLTLTTADNKDICFCDILQFELHYFSDQNVLFDIYEYTLDSIPKELENDYPFLKTNMRPRYFCYHLSSSTGLTGVVIASTLT